MASSNFNNYDDMPYEYSFQNAPPNLKPAFKDFANQTLTNCHSKLLTAIDNVDIEGALFHIGLLTRYLELKYPITRKIRAELCRLCLILLFEFPTDLMQQITIMKVATKLIKNENLSTVGFDLDWKPFYNLLKSTHYSCCNGATQMDQKGIVNSHASKLKELIKKAQCYFTQASFAQILDEILPYFNPHDIYYNRSVELLSLFLPYKQLWVATQLNKYEMKNLHIQSTIKYDANTPHLLLFLLDQILNETIWMVSSPEKLLQILTNLISFNRQFTVYFEPFLSALFHYLYLNAELPINGRSCILKKADRLRKGSLSKKSGFSFHQLGIQNIVQLLIYLMDNRGDSSPVTTLFIEFFNNTQNYFYPSENRRTSSFSLKLTSILASFSLSYSTRYWRELRGYDNTQCNAYKSIPNALKTTVYSWHAFFNKSHPFYRELEDRYKLQVSPLLFASLLPIIKWSIYAKSAYIQYGGYSAIKTLSTLFPTQTTQWAMDEITECLQSITQSHRLSIGIGLLDAITPTLIHRYLFNDNIQLQFVQFLKLILFGIDPSLNKQCTLTMSYLDNIFTKIPIISAKEHKLYDNECKYDDEDGYKYNDSIGRQSTYVFEEFALLFCDKILSYARDSSTSLDSLKTSGSTNDTSGIRNFVPRSNRLLLKKFKKSVYSFWFAISKDIYVKCREKVFRCIDEPQCGSLGGIILSGMIYPYPQQSLDLFLPKIITKILFTKNAKNNLDIGDIDNYKYQPDLYELRGSKEVLMYYLGLIEAVVIPSHSYIIKYIPILSNIVTICMNSALPEIKKYAGPILQAVIVTLCRETPLEARSFSPDIWREDGSWQHWRDWGQFTELEMKGMYKTWRPNLKLKWFYPTQREFAAIQELINYTLSQPLVEINEFIRSETTDIAPKLAAEQLLEYVRVLYHFCYGIGHLGDFDVDAQSELLPTVKEDNYFTVAQNSSHNYFTFVTAKGKDDAVYGELNKLRAMIKLPGCTGTQFENVSLRTAFARLCIALYRKLGHYSDTSDYIIDASELPEEEAADADMSQSDTSFSNINVTEIMAESKSENDDEAKEKSLTALKKSKLFPGVSKVLVWLNTFVNVMMNHDGVMWGVVSNHFSGVSSFLRRIRGDDIFTGHIYNNRAALVNEAHALTLKRLYFLYNHNSYTTDVRSLVQELAKCSISEFENVRKQAIHAIISGRSIYNFRSAVEWAFKFWLKIIGDHKSEKCQLLGATHALKNRELMSQLILRTSQRDRGFISALLSCSIHREPLVQSSIYQIFFTYFNTKKYRTIYLPPNIGKTAERKKEIEIIDANLKKEHQLLQAELLYIAQNEIPSIRNNKLNVTDWDSVSSSNSTSGSYVKIPSTPNDPVVTSLASLINNLDLQSLNIDFKNIPFDLHNVTPQALSAFLTKQGFNLPSTIFNSLSQQQLQSIIDSSQLGKYIKNINKTAAKKENNSNIKESKESVNVHWKYQLMATILLWKSLRPNIAPNKEFIQYITKLIGNEIPSLNRVAITSLTTIMANYLPLLHYKNVIKDVDKYPIEHTFGWRTGAHDININDLCAAMPLYMRPRAQLSSQCASMIHEYLSNNLDILYKAFATDHPHIVDPSAPQQNRRSSETQLRKLIKLEYLWPYDGYDVTLDWWEHTHYILTRDILRCKWPNTNDDANVAHWKYDQNLWILSIDQFNIHAANMKEKEEQLAAGEILAGILRAYHQFAAINKLPESITVSLLCQKISEPLLKIMQQCPQESEDNWCSAIRAGLANSDPRAVEWFTRPILAAVAENLQIKQEGKEEKQYISPEKQVRAMRYGTEILISYGYRGEKEWRYLLSALAHSNENVFDCYFANTYRSVRGDIGILLGQIVRCLRTKASPLLSIYDCTKSDAQFVGLLEMVERRYLSLWQLQNEEESEKEADGDQCTKKFNHLLETLCFWLLQCYNHNNVIFYQSLFVRLLPLILYGQHREDKKTMEVVKMSTEVIAWTSFHESQVLQIFDCLLDRKRTPKLINNCSWKIRKEILEFLLQFICRNAVILNKNEGYQELLMEYLINYSLRDKQLEVRLTAQNVLTALIQSTNVKNVEKIKRLQCKFEQLSRTKLPKRNYESVQSGFDKKMKVKLRKKHCGILGLSSLILSVPYTCPEWIPQILSFVAVFDRERAPIGTTAKKTVAEFKRTHQDEWHIFKRQFSLEQLSNIQDASSTSYFV